MPEHLTESSPTTTSEQTTAPNHPSRVGRLWVELSFFVVILLLLMIFILQNSNSVHIHYLGASVRIDFGVAMLLAALAGSILTLLIGSVRILQLKRSDKK